MTSSSEITAEDIIDTKIISGVSVSPSGKQVIYCTEPYGRKGEHTVSSIWLVEYGKRHSAQQLTSGLFNDRNPKWSPDEKSIAFTSDRHKAGESKAIYILPLKLGGEAFPITPAESKKGISGATWSPCGNFISYLSADEKTAEKEKKDKDKDDAKVFGEHYEMHSLRLVHVVSRSVTVLYKGPMHVTSHAWNPDSKKIIYTLQENPVFDAAVVSGVKFEVVTVADPKPETLYTHPAVLVGGDVGWNDRGIYFNAGVVHAVNSSMAIWQLPLDTKKPVRIAHGDEDDATDFRAEKDYLCCQVLKGLEENLQVQGGAVLYTGTKKIRSWDVKKSSEDSFAVALVVSSASEPYEVYSVDSATEKLTQLSNHNSKLAAAKLGTAHAITCKSYDGKAELEGHFVVPGSSPEGPSNPLPTFVMVHGGPSYHETEHFFAPHFPWMPYILAGGKYGCFVVNYRGNQGHGEKHSSLVRGTAGTDEHDDILALVDEAIKQGFVDQERIIIGGWSYGGLLSYLAAVRNGRTTSGEKKSWRYKGCVPGAGISDWDSMAFTSDVHHFQAEMSGISPWASEEKNDIRGRKGSAIYEIGKIGTAKDVPPILILHGEADVRVPVSQAWAFQRACAHWKVPCEMVTYPREGHSIVEKAHLVDMLRRVRKFADLHLS